MELPALEVEKEMEFDWDQELRVTARAMEALELMRVALERYGAVGEPMWPVVQSFLYAPSWRGRRPTRWCLLSPSTPACTAGGAVLRTSPDEPGVEVVGCFRLAADLPCRSFIEPSALPDCAAVASCPMWRGGGFLPVASLSSVVECIAHG